MTDELKHIIQLIDDMRDNHVIEAAIRAHVQNAIDAALHEAAEIIAASSRSRLAQEGRVDRDRYLYEQGIGLEIAEKVVYSRIGTNPLAERDAMIAELESLLEEAYADADDVLRPRIEELEHMLSEEPHNIPTKYVQHGGVTFALHGSSSIQAYEELERELAEARKEAGTEYGWLVENGKQGDELRYRTIRQGLPEWTDDHDEAIRFARRADAEIFAAEDEDAWSIVQHAWHTIDAAMRQEAE